MELIDCIMYITQILFWVEIWDMLYLILVRDRF
jgi:hypothetical protein